MTTNPWERLREAAIEAVWQGLTGDAEPVRLIPGEPLRARLIRLREALAALPATPPQQPVPDAERERAIKEWRKEITAYARALLRDEQIPGRGGDKLIDEAVALMRSSAPQPAEKPRGVPVLQPYKCDLCGHDFYDTAYCCQRRKEYMEAGDPQAEKPTPPASDWREQFEASRNSTAETLCLRDGLIAAEDRIAALEAEVANLRSQVLP